jgi:hypothetical protein
MIRRAVASRTQPPLARRSVRAVLATAILGALLVATAGATTAGASGRQQQPGGDEAGETSGTRLVLVEQAPWVRPGEQLRVRFRVEGAPADAIVQLVIHRRLVRRGDVADAVEGELGGQEAAPLTRPLAELVPGTDGSYELTVPINAPDGVDLEAPGAYPVELRVTDGPGTELANLVTYLLLPGDFPPLNVAVVMEIGGPPGLRPDGTVQPDEATIAHLNSRIGALTQAAGVPLTIAPVPETLDALANWGEQGRNALERLRQAVGDREILSRPYVDLDLDALAAAGLLSQVPPEALAGSRVVRDQLHEPLEQTWLTGPGVGDAEASALRDLGIGRVIVPEAAIEGVGEDEGPVPVGPVTFGDDGGPLVGVSDDALAGRLLGTEGVLDVQRFLAELTMMWLTRPSVEDRAVVVRIPEDAPVDPTVLGGALRALADAGPLRAIGLGEYFALPPAEDGDDDPIVVERTPAEPSTDLRSLTSALEKAQRDVTGLAATLDSQDVIQSLHRSLLISLATELTPAQRRAYIDRVGAVVAAVSAGINAPPEFTITLTARTGTIPLTIENRTEQNVSVDVQLQSNQLEFPEGNQLNVNVPPGGRRVDLKVRTRTSGAFPLHITLASPDHTVVFDRTTFTIRSTAVSGVGLVLSVGAGAFLLIWWARHWRTARRSRRLIGGGTSGPGSPGGPGAPGGPGGPGTPDATGTPAGTGAPGAPASALASLSTLPSAPPPPVPPRPDPTIQRPPPPPRSPSPPPPVPPSRPSQRWTRRADPPRNPGRR